MSAERATGLVALDVAIAHGRRVVVCKGVILDPRIEFERLEIQRLCCEGHGERVELEEKGTVS